ncbi:MAG: hypothetical protein AB8G99_09980 [Planctomycetaceae bacterium]
MDGSRAMKLLLMVGLAAFVVVVGSRAFLDYQPPVPGEPSLAETTAEPDGRPTKRTTNDSLEDNELVQDRIRRLQAVIRSQRSELADLRPKATPPAKKNIKANKVDSKKSGLLSRLPDLSVFGAAESSELSKEELSDQLARLREISIELKDQLQSAETVVEMQSSEIDDLQEEIEVVRERLSALTDEQSETDEVLEEMLAESRDIERTARRVLVELGPPAVAMLLTLGDDERAHVRRWVRDIIAETTRGEDPAEAP